MKKVFKTTFIILLLVIFLSSCTDSIIIGANLELSGAFAPYGAPVRDAVILATEQASAKTGKGVKAVFQDNRSNAVDAVGATLLLKQQGANVIFGPTISTLTKSALCSQADVLIITPSATADLLTQMDTKTRIIRLCFNDTSQGERMAQFANEKGYKSALILTDLSSDYSRGTSESFKKTFLGSCATRYFLSGDSDFFSILCDFLKNPPDCIYLPAYYTEAGVIIKQARILGLNCAILSGDAIDSPLLKDIVGDKSYLKNVYYTAHTLKGDAYKQFENDFYNRFGYMPSTYAALMYDSVNLYIEKLLENDIQNVEKALFNTVSYNGICGEITVLQNGECLKKPVVVPFGE
jgi:branched-chain amino acid transport system substrate-binding protein